MSDKLRQLFYLGFILIGLFGPVVGNAQTHEATQLILNYQKLTQLQKILENMVKGYTILDKGYTNVKNIAEGNFKLHEAFLNEQLQVSPEVRNYYRIAEIIGYQQHILREYLSVYNRVKNEAVFSQEELMFLREMYGELFKISFRNLDELFLVLTAGELRMSDFERLEAVDRLHTEMSGMLMNLRQLNGKINSLYSLRVRMANNRDAIGKINGIDP